MSSLDYSVVIAYLIGIVLVGVISAGRNRTSGDMFAAGGQSPWWASGLSSFMTMFSANTFVVWGGIAYRLGMTAVMINLMYGVAALLAGYFVAGHWKRLGVRTPAEYVQLRFGSGALHFYTWSMMVFRLVGVAGALYALARILVALMPLSEGHLLADPSTGNLALHWAILIFGGVVVVYTMLGGLWAVLMTDVLQFLVLNLAVAFVVPLAFWQIGGVGRFVAEAPSDFFAPIGGDYTWFFLAGWCAIHFFMIGAEWAFVQRFICVPNAQAARKSSYLFGMLYLVSPLLWLLPPMLWRVMHPIPDGADEQTVMRLSENAYIKSVASTLPSGMVGLMFAAMFSATASMVSSQLNVFSGVLTNDVYRPLVKRQHSERDMVWAGRVFTVLLGAVIMAIALAIPALGGAEEVIIGITELMVVALLAPALWGVFSRRISVTAVWVTGGVGVVTGLIVRGGLAEGGLVADLAGLAPIADWVQANGTYVKTFTGVVLPVLVLAAIQFGSRGTAAGYERLMQWAKARALEADAVGPTAASTMPARVVGWALVLCAGLMGSLAAFNTEAIGVLLAFAGGLGLLAMLVLGLASRKAGQPGSEIDRTALK
jgi:Na+/proline symporter